MPFSYGALHAFNLKDLGSPTKFADLMINNRCRVLIALAWDEYEAGMIEADNRNVLSSWASALHNRNCSLALHINPRADMKLAVEETVKIYRQSNADFVLYDTEDDFSYSKHGGEGYARMSNLMKFHKEEPSFINKPFCISAPGRLDLLDCHWAAAAMAGATFYLQAYGISESWPHHRAIPCVKGAMAPWLARAASGLDPFVIGHSYRMRYQGGKVNEVRIKEKAGSTFYLLDNGLQVDSFDRKIYDKGKKVGVLLGYVAGAKLKIKMGLYQKAQRPTPEQVFTEIKEFQTEVARRLGSMAKSPADWLGWAGYTAGDWLYGDPNFMPVLSSSEISNY